jgi:hypothetical protein
MAAVQLTVALFDAMMKEIYPSWKVESLAKRKRPLLDWMKKSDEFYGDTLVVPVLYEDPQSAGHAVLSDAVATAETTKQTKFVLTARSKAYGEVQIEAEAIMAASKDVGSFIRAKSAQIDGMIRQMGKQLHTALYRSGSGSVGQVTTITADNPAAGQSRLLLSNKSDVYNFGIGMVLEANNTDDSTSPKINAEVVKVNALNAADGYVFVDKDVINDLTTTAWANADYLFLKGNAAVGVVTGLAGWLPLTAPTSGDSHYSVDRSAYVEALAGHRVDDTSRSILTNMQELAMKIAEFASGAEGELVAFTNPRSGLQLAEEVGAKVERTEPGRAKVGFDGFTIHSFVTGPIDVIFDIGCPPNRLYILDRSTWTFAHMGGVPHIIRDDGLSALRDAAGSYDGIAVRTRYFGEVYCNKPGYNGVMSVATA